jgi:hypothetical protein
MSSAKITVTYDNGVEQEIEAESFVLVAFQKATKEEDPKEQGLLSIRSYEFPEATGYGLMESIDAMGERMLTSPSKGHQMIGQAVQGTIKQGRDVLKQMAKELEGTEH